jgi:branched-subunit amino acid aminotransferase/4-amino-4-deoxychorismate lyase
MPERSVIVSSVVLPVTQASRFKVSSRMPYVLARAEAEAAGADDALLLNSRNEIVEASASNFFWMDRGIVFTTPLSSGALAGIARETIIRLCRELKLPLEEKPLRLKTMWHQVQSAFLTNSAFGVAGIARIDGRNLKRSPMIKTLYTAYWDLVETETSSSNA